VEGRPLEESDLVERAKHHDVNAYETLVQRYQELAFRAAYHVTGDASEAEDAAQDAFVKAYYALGRFRSGAPFKPWLLRIVTNEATNRRVSAGRRIGLQQRAAALAQASGDAAHSPEAAAEARERRETILRAMGKLSQQDRTVLAYKYFLDLGEVEMAIALKCARGTVKSRLSRSLNRLRAALADGAGRR
jgi:RNA polymerase sigma-70 factor, ECF subfamily